MPRRSNAGVRLWLGGVFRSRRDRLRGIRNGVDYNLWNPATDKLIAANYSAENMGGKIACKKALLEGMGVRTAVARPPVVGIVSRLRPRKASTSSRKSRSSLPAMDLYVVALGTGDPVYEELFRNMAATYPDKFLVVVAYDNTLAHRIRPGLTCFDALPVRTVWAEPIIA